MAEASMSSGAEKVAKYRRLVVFFACLGLVGLVSYFYSQRDDGLVYKGYDDNVILSSSNVYVSDTVAKERAAIARRKEINEINRAEAVLKAKILAEQLSSLQKQIGDQGSVLKTHLKVPTEKEQRDTIVGASPQAVMAAKDRLHTMALKNLIVKRRDDDDVTKAHSGGGDVRVEDQGNARESRELRMELKHIEQQEDNDLQSLKHKIEGFGSKERHHPSHLALGTNTPHKAEERDFFVEKGQSLALKSSDSRVVKDFNATNATLRKGSGERYARGDGYLSDKTLNDVLRLAREDEEYFHYGRSFNRSSLRPHDSKQNSVASNASSAVLNSLIDLNSSSSSSAAAESTTPHVGSSIATQAAERVEKHVAVHLKVENPTKSDPVTKSEQQHQVMAGNISAAKKKPSVAKYAIKEINPLKVIDQALMKEAESSERKTRETVKKSPEHAPVIHPAVREEKEVKKSIVVHKHRRSDEKKDWHVIDPLKIINKAYDEEKMKRESKSVEDKRMENHRRVAAERLAKLNEQHLAVPSSQQLAVDHSRKGGIAKAQPKVVHPVKEHPEEMNPLEIINEALKKESESTQPKAKVPSKPAKGSIRYMFGDKVGAKVGSLIRKVRKSEGISPRKESRGAKGVHPSILDTDKDKEAMNDLEQMDKEGLLKSVQAKQKRLERIASHGGKKVKFGEREQEAMKDLELLDKRGMLKKTSQALQGSREGDEEQEQEQDDGQDSGHSMLNLFGSQAKARYHDLTKWRSKG